MTDKKRKTFVDFIYGTFPDDDEKAEEIIAMFDMATELPYKVGETIYYCVRGEDPKYIGVQKDTINSVTAKFTSEGVTYDVEASLLDFKVSEEGFPSPTMVFKKFSTAKNLAEKLAEKLNLEIIAFS